MSTTTHKGWDGEEPQARGFVIDLPTALVGILCRSPLILIAIVVGALVGQQFAEKKGTQIYEASTIVQYNDLSPNKVTTDVRTLVTTAKDQVKLRSNLVEVARRLDLKVAPDVLGKACDVDIQKNTTLMVITVRWKSKTEATDIANTLRDTFLEKQLEGSRSVQAQVVRKLQERLTGIRRQQKESDSLQQKFVTSNDIIDIDKQSRALLDQYNSMTVLLEQAQAERTTVQQQVWNIQKVIGQLKNAVSRERSAKNAQTDSTGEVAARIDRLRAMISDDKVYRANVAELAQREQDVIRYKRLFEKGIVARAVLERAQTEFTKQKVLTEDTTEIQEWRKELELLQKQIRPNNSESSMSSTLLQGMMSRTFEIQLQSVAVDEKVRYLTGVRAKVKTQIKRIPVLQRQYIALTRNTAALSAERNAIQEKIGLAREALQTQTSGFGIISPAVAQDRAVESNRMTYAVGAAGGIVLLVVLIIVALEVLDTRIKSPMEAQLRLGLPILGAIPEERNIAEKILAIGVPQRGAKRNRLAEQLSLIARRMRKQRSELGDSARFLMVGATHDEGVTTVITGLAAALARQEENVLLLDAQTHRRPRSASLSDLVGGDSRSSSDLSDYLSTASADPTAYVATTRLSGVSCIPLRQEAEISTDGLGSKRMGQLLEEMGRRFGIVLLEAPPVTNYPDAEMLTQYATTVVLVVRCFHRRAAVLQEAIDQLKSAGVPVSGVILTHVGFWYRWRR